jgi:hypothetical protein
MRVLPSVLAGLLLSCGAAHAADCSKNFPTSADVTKATGLAIASVQDVAPSCVYSTVPDKSGAPTQIALSRMEGNARQTFDVMIQAMSQSKMTCEKITGIGDDSRICMPPGAAMQVTIVTLKGGNVYSTTVASPAAMTDKAAAAKLPDTTKALATAFVAK